MKRRTFMKNFAASAAVPGAVGGASLKRSLHSLEKIEWRMIAKFRVNPTHQDFTRVIGEASAGQLNIELLSMESKLLTEAVEDLRKGNIEMGFGNFLSSPPEREGEPALEIVPAACFLIMPFGLTSQEYNVWIEYGGGLELVDRMYEHIGCKYFPAGNTGIQMGGWFNREINVIEDLKGLKIRISGFGAEVLRAAGAEPYDPAPWSEDANQALSDGHLDAFERGSPASDMASGLHERFKYYYYPAWHEPSVPRGLVINRAKWDELPLHLKTIVSTTARWLNYQWMNDRMAGSAVALETLVEDHGVQLRRFPEPVLKELAEISYQIMKERASRDKLSQEVFDSIMRFKKRASSWAMVSLHPFLTARGNLLRK